MMMLDIFTLTLLFLLALVVVTIVLMNVYQRGYRAGEQVGEQRERALSWERTVRARERVEALAAAARVDDCGGEWELPDQKI